MTEGPLILASGSPQRRAILTQLGIPFEVRVPDVEELDAGPPEEVTRENAYRKAAAIADAVRHRLVLGVDTIVALGGRLYGKPRDAREARAAITALAGRRHQVISGICLIEGGKVEVFTARTAVELRAPDEQLIDWYLRSGEWRGRAGAYAIQGRGAALVAAIEGDYSNVVGLPISTLLDLRPALLWA